MAVYKHQQGNYKAYRVSRSVNGEQIQKYTSANPFRAGWFPRETPGNGPTQLAAEQDLRLIRTIVEAKFDEDGSQLDIQCRFKMTRIVIVEGIGFWGEDHTCSKHRPTWHSFSVWVGAPTERVDTGSDGSYGG